MRSALLCVFFALIIHDGSRASDSDFRPIPIPLDAYYEKREGRVGTLHEAINTDAPPAVAAVPAHYWEDALRHSVYLTLVRDKIDQLIARGVVVSPNTKQDQYVSKEIDDHDLWEKIKKAPFDRLKEEDSAAFGDVTVMAKGRLMEDNGGYRFTEDERTREDCSDDKCMEGVKAFWSVKRVRQRDVETSPGRYHYELTFSVNSQPPKKQRKPFENPVRTFTVRENAQDAVLGTPQEYPVYQPMRPQGPRPQRAVWFHKNIAPKQITQGRYYTHGLDRIFSSFFSDDETHAEPPHRYKVNPYPPPMPPMYPPYSKAGYVGVPSDQHHQKRLMPYPYKPHHTYKYRPPLPPPPVSHVQQHFIDVDVVKHPYVQQHGQDHRYISSSNVVKTTRPAVLPPPTPILNTTDEFSSEIDINQTNIEESKNPEAPTTHTTTVYKTHSKPRPSIKGNYYPEHIRPPIYNAPPGVFVTMEKKPFKPMPPLKYNYHSNKPKRPIDFRPSPQLIDGQFTSPDTEVESVFRPILHKNQTEANSTKDVEVSQGTKHTHKQKQASKKPPKKHENIKWPGSTSVPEIITASNNHGDEDTYQWADVLGAFTKTTPMHSQKTETKSHSEEYYYTDSTTTTTQMTPYPTKKDTTTITEAYEEPTTKATSPTTPVSKKRTRPPPKFVKPEKAKKHKRVTTTTTTAPEKLTLKKPSDLTPQASSAATHSPTWKSKNKTTTVTPSTEPSTTTTTTTTMSTTTSTSSPTTSSPPAETTTKPEPDVKPTQPKNKNRFRLTTLMQRGTSVKHDHWSVNNTTTEKKPTVLPQSKNPPRRKGSNFQGYAAPSTSNYSTKDEVHRVKQFHGHHARSTTETVTVAEVTAAPTQSSYDEIPIHFNVESTSAYTQHNNYDSDEDNDDDESQDIEVKPNNNYEQESADQVEFIFNNANTPSEKTNEIIDEELSVTEQTVLASTHTNPRNKTKCKKKKQHHLVSTTTVQYEEDEQPTTTLSSTATKSSSTGIDLLDELLGSFTTYDETTEKSTDTKSSRHELEEEESENHEKYLMIDEDFEEFIGNIGGKRNRHHSDDKDDVDYEDEDPERMEEDDVSPFDNDDEDSDRSRASTGKDYEDYRERPYSLLELMAME